MGPAEHLYRVRVNSSGLIYAVIVGAWAAYLVPMWLRRQDELNESRPTERFSTAIRLLSGKAAMERRYGKGTERRDDEVPEDQGLLADPGLDTLPVSDDSRESAPDFTDEAIDVRAFADPKTMVGESVTAVAADVPSMSVEQSVEASVDDGHSDGGRAERDRGEWDPGERDGGEAQQSEAKQSSAERNKARKNNKRAKVLARRRRTTLVLFLAFTAGTVVAAVGGLALLWAPAVPGLLLSAYIVHLRVQERRRYAVSMDKRGGEAAAQRLRERRLGGPAPDSEVAAGHPGEDEQPESAPAVQQAEEPGAADRRALVEQTDHAEWVDQQRRGDREPAEGWDPVPVPLPTYVSAPVAPRSTRGVDLEALGTWSSARSSAASDETSPAGPTGQQEPDEESSRASRRGRGHGRTPLFDQYEGDGRRRAANE
jgi:hypothetical protein